MSRFFLVLGVLVAVFGLAGLALSFTTVAAGQVGVVTRYGPVVNVLQPGATFVTPFIDEVHKFNTQFQTEQANAVAASADQQDVQTTIAVIYSIDASHVADLYSKVGADYKAKVIDSNIQEVVKGVTAQYTAKDLLAKRPEVGDKIKTNLEARLEPYYIAVSQVNIVNFQYSDEYTKAIEAKVTAEQNAITAQHNLDAARFDAEAIKVRSEAANNEKYIELQRLEVEKSAIEKWNGKLPDQMIPGQSLPFINLSN